MTSLKTCQCINPDCLYHNSYNNIICHRCGSKLLLAGRYRAVRQIGAGGFARTFEAVDEHRLNTVCLIKQFCPLSQSSTAYQKSLDLFKQEAVILKDLGQHPKIPALLAFFEQEGRLYIIQEFIEGQDLLREVKQSGAFNEQKVRQVLLELLPVLEFIHQRGIIHRDIKPSNIIRRPDSSLVLIDFGGSHQLSVSVSLKKSPIAGTPGYAAPEQMRGVVSPASDLYSLGVTCIRLLSGCFPTDSGSDSLFDLQQQQWDWQGRGVSVSPELERILKRMLQLEARDRFESVAEVLGALEDGGTGREGDTYQLPVISYQLSEGRGFQGGDAGSPHSPSRGQRAEGRGQRAEGRGQKADKEEFPNHQSPITNHQSPVTSHQSPITNHQSLFTNHQSPITSHSSPITNHQSPITNHQSPITNHQSPITNHQSPITSHSSPITSHSSPVTNHLLTNPQSPIITHQSSIPNPQSPITNTRSLSLASQVGVDYSTLQDLLAAGKYQEADRETWNLMLRVACRDKEGCLNLNAIEQFPCTDLYTLDHLWQMYSGGHFGFSIQKQIYESLEGTRGFNYQIWQAFGDRVGWHREGNWLNYLDLTFARSAPQGQLPASFVDVLNRAGVSRGVCGWWRLGFVSLIHRLDECSSQVPLS